VEDALEFRGNARFELVRRLGAGGMGVVWEAVDKDRNVRVALKTLRHMTADGVLRFKNEFRALQDVSHPNLVSFGELIEHEGCWFFTMEHVDGLDFLDHVRPRDLGAELELSTAITAVEDAGPDARAPSGRLIGAVLDERRLRQAILQLAQAVAALHASAQVHRDIKPSNVLVANGGRVVLLDFGLVAPVASADRARDEGVVGTADYMAPEQAAGQPAGPEADWYSVGVMLYQALTGRLPFGGDWRQILADKQRFEPPPPRAIAPDVAADLDALCADLLRIVPSARPPAREILARLGAAPAEGDPRTSSTGSFKSAPFVGRAHELKLLREAFVEARGGKTTAIVIVGESGLGKSVLARRFADNLNAVVLAGRCYERETVPFKAIDGVIDSLSRYLGRLEEREAAALVPRSAHLLANVFPVLRRVRAIAAVEAPRGVHQDPLELRARLFAALRELLGRIAQRNAVVLVIDDLQWADSDSALLLRELLRQPGAPALLLLATSRAADKLPLPDEGTRVLPLARLGAEETRELVCALSPQVAAGSVDVIVRETAGHPLFVDELVRHVAARGVGDLGAVRLDEALRRRLATLSPTNRRVLELVAVAGTVVTQEVLARAAAVEPGELDRAISTLRAASFVRTGGVRPAANVEPYHDKIGELVRGDLDAGARKQHHRDLALALEALAADAPLAVAINWQGAGELERAGVHFVRAAEEAEAALAFDRAARLYQMALAAGAPPKLRGRLGDALSKAGRGVEAARAYEEALPGAMAAEALDLRRRAAEEYLMSGHIDEGLAAVRSVVAEVGLSLPSTPRRALASLIAQRARLALRGYGFKKRDASEIAARELEKIDLCYSVSRGLSLVDNILGSDFQTRGLLIALGSGEPGRVARALAMEAGFRASTEPAKRKSPDKLIAAAEKLASDVDDPYPKAMVALATSITNYCRGRWMLALEYVERAITAFRERCIGVAWELDSAHMFLGWTLVMLGRFDEAATRIPALARDADERGDLYAAVSLRIGHQNTAYLVGDDPDAAQREIDRAEQRWTFEGFHLQHYWRLLARTQLALYLGRGAEAVPLIEDRWPALERSLILRIRLIRVEASHLRARLHLAAAASAPSGPERRRHVAEAVSLGRRLRKIDMPWCPPFGDLIDAAAARLEDRADDAAKLLQTAAQGFEIADMQGYAAGARLTLGKHLGGKLGRALIQSATHAFESRKVRDPDRMARMLVPGF
jgi:hypothetical protein